MQRSRLMQVHRRATVCNAVELICGGYSRARQIMFDAVDKARWVDPSRKVNAAEDWAVWPVAVADTYGIYDDRIESLYERSGGDVFRFLAVLRALDLGLLPKSVVAGGSISMDWLMPAVYRKAPLFGTGQRPKPVTK